MTATLGDPHTLASYPISQHLKTNTHHVFTYAPVGNDRDFSATIGVQGDGIHIVDLNTLQDDASLIAEPSTSFAAPPVSRLERGPDSKPKRYTYAAIERAVGIEVSAQRRTIWSWTSQDSLGSLERQDSVTLTHTVSYLFAPHWMPSTVLAVSETGQATLLDQSLSVERTHSPTSSHGKLLGSFVFPSRDASFVPLSARTGFSSNSAILVNIFSNHSTVTVSSILVGDDLRPLGDATFEHPQTVDVLCISCSIDGIMSLLGESGSWESLQLLQQGDTFTLSQIGRPISLTALSVPQSTTVALTSSHVLLASITSSQPPNITFLLWDLQYSVLLAERQHPLPPYLSGLPLDNLQLKLTIAPKSLALLVVRPSITVEDNEKKNAVGIKSLVLSIPYAVPESSSLKNALGKAPFTQKWIAPSKGRKLAGKHASERDVLKSLEDKLKEGHIEKAEEAFFEWLEIQARHPGNGVQINGTGDYEEESDGGTSDGGHPKKSGGQSRKTTWKLHINYPLACALLATVLQPDQPKAPYSPKIVHCLLKREIVRDSMLDGGILKPLRDRSDWLGVELAMQNVNDIPEADLIDTLRDCISAHLAMQKGDGSTMDVDHVQRSLRTPLSLDRMVSLLVGYPVSAPPFRVALRDILSNAEEITAVLKVLATWVKAWGEKGAIIRVDGEIDERDPMKRASKVASGGNKGALPRLDLVAAFLNHLLDSSLVSLLQYRPAHALLQQLTDDLEPQVSLLEELDVLRGPLEPFVRAYNSREKASTEQNARQKEKEAYKAAEIRLGLYQIEELFL